MKTKEFKVVPIVIGGIADFIAQKVRYRGIILSIDNGLALLGVVGSRTVWNIPVDELAPVKDHTEIINVLRD